MTALLTDEEIRSTAATERDCYKHRGFDFEAGARFARSIYEADRAKLLDRIAELEGMVPKWVEVGSEAAGLMEDCGWRFHRLSGERAELMLMVPPIPLPKGGE